VLLFYRDRQVSIFDEGSLHERVAVQWRELGGRALVQKGCHVVVPLGWVEHLGAQVSNHDLTMLDVEEFSYELFEIVLHLDKQVCGLF